jgi:hypothetical protein
MEQTKTNFDVIWDKIFAVASFIWGLDTVPFLIAVFLIVAIWLGFLGEHSFKERTTMAVLTAAGLWVVKWLSSPASI